MGFRVVEIWHLDRSAVTCLGHSGADQGCRLNLCVGEFAFGGTIVLVQGI